MINENMEQIVSEHAMIIGYSDVFIHIYDRALMPW